MKILIYLTIFGNILVNYVSTVKTWLPNLNYNNPKNWDLGRLPCPQDTVIFPKEVRFIIFLPEGETSFQKLIFPEQSLILLPVNGKLVLSENDVNTNCEGKDITYLHERPHLWVDPNNWSGHNPATPDLETIPCPTDRIAFTENSSFAIVLPDVEIEIGVLTMNGKNIGQLEWNNFQRTLEAIVRFDKPHLITINGNVCSDFTGCECFNQRLKNEVCSSKGCPETLCYDPVTPYGNCCPICGAFIFFDFDNYRYREEKLKKFLDNELKDKNVYYHISKISKSIQIVLKEYDVYTEKLKEIADEISDEIKNKYDLGLLFDKKIISGVPIYPGRFKVQLIIFFTCMIISTVVIGILIFYHTNIVNNLDNGAQYLYAVFENRSEEVELIGSNGSGRINVPKRSAIVQAFDNPMYRSTSELYVEKENNTTENLYVECPENPKENYTKIE